MRTYFMYFCLVAVITTFWGCTKRTVSQEHSEPPSAIQNAVQETDLTTITLTREAEQRLGIELATVEYRTVEKNKTYGGEVVPVSGRSVTITAPLSGTLLLPENGFVAAAGLQVSTSEPMYRLLLALPEQDILSVREEVSLLQSEFDLAQKTADRAQQLLDDRAGSLRDLEEAQAQLSKAEASLKVARARLDLLQEGQIDVAGDGVSSLIIKSPIDGVIQKVHVAPGQAVTGSQAIVEIAGIDPVWIKVPVYVGDLSVIDPNRPSRVHDLGDFADFEARAAEPVVASFSANPQSLTADIFYELSNTDLLYRPGQKVGVTIPLRVSEQTLVVPYSSILYDMYGGVWVYENTESQKYVRRRVELHYVLGELAVLFRGPEAGTSIVTAGAAELFGTEFGEAGH